MKKMDSETALARAAMRAGRDRYFVGWYLAQFAEMHEMQPTVLATFLECAPDRVPSLALCRAPLSDATAYREDVKHIAAFVGANPARLVSLLREVSAVHALRGASMVAEGQSSLMAARDRAAQHEEPPGHPPEMPKRGRKGPKT